MTSTRPHRPQTTRRPSTGATVWLTGLPSAGKTTLALRAGRAAARRGPPRRGARRRRVRDVPLRRPRLHPRRTGTPTSRRIGFVAELLARHGVMVLVPVIAPYADSRDEVRAPSRRARHRLSARCTVATPVEVCAERDVKGLYAKAGGGEISRHDRGRRPVRGARRTRTCGSTPQPATMDESVGARCSTLLTERGLA